MTIHRRNQEILFTAPVTLPGGASTNDSGDEVINDEVVNGQSNPKGKVTCEDVYELAHFTVDTAPDPTVQAGDIIYASNGADGDPVPAFSDGTNWLRWDDRTPIAAGAGGLLAEALRFEAQYASNDIDTVPNPDLFNDWEDINSATNTLTAIGGNRPELGNDGAEDYGLWDALNTKLEGPVGGIFTDIFDGGGTVMVVANIIDPTADELQGNLFGIGNVTAMHPSQGTVGFHNIAFLVEKSGANFEGLTTTEVADNAVHIYDVRADATDADPDSTLEIGIDGATENSAAMQFTSDGSGTYTAQTSMRFVVGNYENQGATSGARIYAVLGWTRILSEVEIDLVRTHYATEHGITLS